MNKHHSIQSTVRVKREWTSHFVVIKNDWLCTVIEIRSVCFCHAIEINGSKTQKYNCTTFYFDECRDECTVYTPSGTQ